MKIDPISRLEDYLKDPASPSWSSQGLIDLFDDLEGTMYDKQQIVLPIVDAAFSSEKTEMTYYQFNFLRDLTLHAMYPKTRVNFTPQDLKWLLDYYAQHPTQQRATMITLLLPAKDLPRQTQQQVADQLRGTFAESFIQIED